jgi:hypothetical protein
MLWGTPIVCWENNKKHVCCFILFLAHRQSIHASCRLRGGTARPSQQQQTHELEKKDATLKAFVAELSVQQEQQIQPSSFRNLLSIHNKYLIRYCINHSRRGSSSGRSSIVGCNSYVFWSGSVPTSIILPMLPQRKRDAISTSKYSTRKSLRTTTTRWRRRK